MKKFLVALLSTAMVVSCCNVAWADDATLNYDDVYSKEGGTTDATDAKSTKPVTVHITKETVYSIDVTWGSMEMQYNYGKWTRGGYVDDNSNKGWTCVADANKVTVTNYSNAQIKWGATFANGDGFEKVSGTFMNSNSTNVSTTDAILDTAEGSVDQNTKEILVDAKSDYAHLTLTGAPAYNASADAGTATVTIKTP